MCVSFRGLNGKCMWITWNSTWHVLNAQETWAVLFNDSSQFRGQRDTQNRKVSIYLSLFSLFLFFSPPRGQRLGSPVNIPGVDIEKQRPGHFFSAKG